MGILKRNVPPKPGRPTVSIIARGNSLRGEITITGKTHIDGRLSGHIMAEEDISIGKQGIVQGSIRGKNIFVSGCLEGDVVCDHLFIEPGGKVYAQACCAEMKIDLGGVFVGERTLPEPLAGSYATGYFPSTADEHGDLLDSLPQHITLNEKS